MAITGFVFLCLALATCVYSIAAHIFSLRTGRTQLSQSARPAALAATGLFTAAVIILLVALINHNFEIESVWQYTSTDMSLRYLISALWASNSGSLLFWGWIVSLCAAIVMLRKRKRGQELVPYASVIIMAVQAFFLLMLISSQNPFNTLEIVPIEGVGLNPMLQNTAMIIHPPLLLGGYAVMTVPFSFAIAALITRKLDDNDWLVAARRWALLGWLALGLGNLIGAWWAYAELGWGGYWAWDPVENAGLMPWLTATAFLHAIMMQQRKGVFKAGSMVLIILTFSLTIFGTYITRSGILESVHDYAASTIGMFLLVFLIIAFFGSLALLIYRRKDLKGRTDINVLVSREGTFLINILLLVGATLFILIGTLRPSLVELFSDSEITNNPAFFNITTVPILLAIILLAGICSMIAWRLQAGQPVLKNLLWPTVAALVVVVVALIFGVRNWIALVAYFLCSLSLAAIFSQWLRDIFAFSRAKSLDFLSSLWRLFVANRRRYGAYIVHISIVIMAIGIIGSSLFDIEKRAEMIPGQHMTINDYTIAYVGLIPEGSERGMKFSAELDVYKGDAFIAKMSPQIIDDINYGSVSEVAIRSTLTEDLYLVLAGFQQVSLEDGSQKILVGIIAKVNPLILWIWIGGYIFLTGGLLAFWPSRKETVESKKPPAQAT
jgi:cytochrome c-type biogenesis protein CcmF